MAAVSLIRPTTARAVHLRITPRASNIGESREILRLISQFGEVEYFKNLKYDVLSAPNTAIVIFKEEEAAAHCLQRSPIRFRMGRASTVEGSEDTKDGVSTLDSRIFQISTNASRANFRDQLNTAHFHGGFMINGKSVAQQDLAKRVPTPGLSDVNWQAGEKPWRVVTRHREEGGAFNNSGPRKSLQQLFEEVG